MRSGRNSIGIETEIEYCNMIANRLYKENDMISDYKINIVK